MPKERYHKFIFDLSNFADDAEEQSHFIEAMVIRFLSLEETLKVYLAGHYRRKGVKEKTISKATYEEKSFEKLAMKLELLGSPDYKFIEELIKANTERNKIIHKLFRNEFKTLKEIQNRAKLNIKRINKCEEKIALKLCKKRLISENPSLSRMKAYKRLLREI